MDGLVAANEITALLGRGTRFEGKLLFSGRVRVDGAFRGEIFGDDVLVVGDGAEVDATIEADVVIVKGGVVRGTIRARRSIELYVPATVEGTLEAPSIFVDKGVKVEGTCSIQPVGEPAGAPSPAASP